MVRETIRENELPTSSGGVAVVVFLLGLLGAVGGLAGAVATVNPVLGVGSVLTGVVMIVLLTGLFVVSPVHFPSHVERGPVFPRAGRLPMTFEHAKHQLRKIRHPIRRCCRARGSSCIDPETSSDRDARR